MGDQILIVPDVHGREFWKRSISGDYKAIVFLGDYLDPYSVDQVYGADALNCLIEIVNLKKMFPDKVHLLLGNHDIPYFQPDIFIPGPRHDWNIHARAEKVFKENRKLFEVAWQEGSYLFSHAGITRGWLTQNGWGGQIPFPESVAEWLDNMSYGEIGLGQLAQCGEPRWGDYEYGSPLWADWMELLEDQVTGKGPLLPGGLFQVVGHSMGNAARFGNWAACLDCAGKCCFILEPDGKIKEGS